MEQKTEKLRTQTYGCDFKNMWTTCTRCDVRLTGVLDRKQHDDLPVIIFCCRHAAEHAIVSHWQRNSLSANVASGSLQADSSLELREDPTLNNQKSKQKATCQSSTLKCNAPQWARWLHRCDTCSIWISNGQNRRDSCVLKAAQWNAQCSLEFHLTL